MRISASLLPLFFDATLGLATVSYRSNPVVDLGYGIYKGYYNSSSDLNIFKGCVRAICHFDCEGTKADGVFTL